MMAAHAYAPSYAQTLHWLEGLVPDKGARAWRDACRPLTTFHGSRPVYLPKCSSEHRPPERELAAKRDFAQKSSDRGSPSKPSENHTESAHSQ